MAGSALFLANKASYSKMRAQSELLQHNSFDVFSPSISEKTEQHLYQPSKFSTPPHYLAVHSPTNKLLSIIPFYQRLKSFSLEHSETRHF